ncbi:sensor histidine kinase [Rubellimicrobium aerolatum]|uniref:histidine kinase n=1 Tax=Rubellimicrobium aerolatum TaxID=490979 RepID=A0ABW0SDX1_9RHOB|nr:HAMP domain-containing sensor histidine kinase [Rubellimicrobium aerolatum]MBP1807017.1 signal transduction histidine kinase [Rubellimicrobium aerolatum]
MRPADLLGRTSVQLALAFALLLIAAFALAGVVAWSLIRQDLGAQADRRILQTWQTIAAEADDGSAELIAGVEEQLAAISDLSTGIWLGDASGARLAGNLPRFDGPSGWSDLSPGALGLSDGFPYRLYARNVGSHLLVVGSANADIHEMGEIVAGALGWASVAALIVALAGGAALAGGIQARIERMETTLDRVGEGDLAARVPVEGRGDLARLGRGINAAVMRLEGLVEGMRQVSTDIAHDLRTPLGRLRMRLEEAAAQAPEGSPLATGLLDALEESDAIDATFAGLLRIAQIEAGARRARFAPLDLAAVLDRIVEAYAGVAEDQGKTLALGPSGLSPVIGDEELLLQLFANLVENALRHGPPGTAIVCGLSHEAGRTTATVRDTGPGIPSSERERVLRRLYRMEASRTSPGTGLGLALVKAVADLHGAELTLGDADPGLLVTLRFPKAGF